MATVERLGCWWTTSNFAITFVLLRYLRKIGKNMSFLCANVKTRKPTSLSWNLWQDSWRNHFLWRLKGLKLRRREGSILCFRDIRLAHYNRLHNIEWIFVIPTSILCQWLNLLIPHSWSVNFLNFLGESDCGTHWRNTAFRRPRVSTSSLNEAVTLFYNKGGCPQK